MWFTSLLDPPPEAEVAAAFPYLRIDRIAGTLPIEISVTLLQRQKPFTAELAEDAEQRGLLCELGALCGEKLLNDSF